MILINYFQRFELRARQMRMSNFTVLISTMVLLGFVRTQTKERVAARDRHAVVAGSTKMDLVRFCAKCTLPRNGVYIATFSDVPEPSTIWLLCLAGSSNKISQKLDLSDSQLDSIRKLSLVIPARGFNVIAYNKALSILNDSQVRKLELAGLLMDGGAALRSDFFVEELTLDQTCKEKIAKEVERFRVSTATPALRATFGGGRRTDLYVWNSVSDSMILNHRIVEHLDAKQQATLASVFNEAERTCGELIVQFWEVILEEKMRENGEKSR